MANGLGSFLFCADKRAPEVALQLAPQKSVAQSPVEPPLPVAPPAAVVPPVLAVVPPVLVVVPPVLVVVPPVLVVVPPVFPLEPPVRAPAEPVVPPDAVVPPEPPLAVVPPLPVVPPDAVVPPLPVVPPDVVVPPEPPFAVVPPVLVVVPPDAVAPPLLVVPPDAVLPPLLVVPPDAVVPPVLVVPPLSLFPPLPAGCGPPDELVHATKRKTASGTNIEVLMDFSLRVIAQVIVKSCAGAMYPVSTSTEDRLIGFGRVDRPPGPQLTHGVLPNSPVAGLMGWLTQQALSDILGCDAATGEGRTNF